jgi:hypothetical protein
MDYCGMKTAYSFLRWSTKGQGQGNRDSKNRQTKSAQDWMLAHAGEYKLSGDVFIGAGESAFKGKHLEKDEQGKAIGALQRFIESVDNETIKKDSVLLVDSVDRLSRLPVFDANKLLTEIISREIGIVFTGSFDTRVITRELINREPHLLGYLLNEMTRAHRESEEKSRKIKSAKQAKSARMKSGEIVAHNNMPKYFSFDRVLNKYAHNQNTPVVKELVQGILSGKSLYFLADDLNKREVKTFRRGFEWSGNSIRQILRNRVLIGEYLGNKDFVPAIIDADTFMRVQVILNQNKFIRGKKAHLVNIFKGLCFCTCGKSMAVATQLKDGTTYRYLRCSRGGRGLNNSCKNHKHIKLDLMEEAFFLHFLNKHPYELLKESEQKEVTEINKKLGTKQTRLDQLNKDFGFVMNLIGQMQADELQTKLVAINTEREKLKVELDQLNLQRRQVEDAPEDLRPVLCQIVEFGTGPIVDLGNGPIHLDNTVNVYADTMEQIESALKDNAAREQTRLLLPSMIGKVIVDSSEGRFYVYTRMGKLIYKSHPQKSQRNKSERWKKSLKEWKLRRVTDGRLIEVKRRK